MIQFNRDVDGIFRAGDVAELDPGTEDAYVTWRGVARYVEPSERKDITRPPADKMMRAPKARKSFANA